MQGKVLPSKAFLTKRAQELEVFVCRCCMHAELRQSKVHISSAVSFAAVGTAWSRHRAFVFLARRQQAASIANGYACLLHAPVLQALTLFLTLQLDGGGLSSHAEWKQVQAEEPLFRSFQLVRAPRAPRESAQLPNVAAQPASLAQLGWQMVQGVSKLGKRVHSTLSSSSQPERTGHTALDSVNSEVHALEQRANLCVASRVRLLRARTPLGRYWPPPMCAALKSDMRAHPVVVPRQAA